MRCKTPSNVFEEKKNQEYFSSLRKNIFLFQKFFLTVAEHPVYIYLACCNARLMRDFVHRTSPIRWYVVRRCSLPASRYTTLGTQPKISFVPIVRRIFMVTLTGLCFRENFWISPPLSVLLYLFPFYLTRFFFSTLVSSLSRTCFP